MSQGTCRWDCDKIAGEHEAAPTWGQTLQGGYGPSSTPENGSQVLGGIEVLILQ